MKRDISLRQLAIRCRKSPVFASFCNVVFLRMSDKQRTSAIQVIDRATSLLDAIARYPEPVSLKVLSAETGLHASTAHRILGSLIDNGFVERDNAGHYRLGLRLLQLGAGCTATSTCAPLPCPRWRHCATSSVNPLT